jgi:hypothetical protein
LGANAIRRKVGAQIVSNPGVIEVHRPPVDLKKGASEFLASSPLRGSSAQDQASANASARGRTIEVDTNVLSEPKKSASFLQVVEKTSI